MSLVNGGHLEFAIVLRILTVTRDLNNNKLNNVFKPFFFAVNGLSKMYPTLVFFQFTDQIPLINILLLDKFQQKHVFPINLELK